MNADERRDAVVAKALTAVPTPGHRPDFWTDLDARLAGEEGGTMTSITGTRPRVRWPYLGLVAALIATLFGATVLYRTAGEQSIRTDPAAPGGVDETPVQPEPSPTTTPPAPTTTPTTAGATTARGAAGPDQAVEQWISAIAAGRLDSAAALTGPRTHAFLDANGAGVRRALEESEGFAGLGGWADYEHSTTEIDLGVVEGVESTVVAVSGEWRGEGEDGFRVDAVPVSRSGAGGTWLVEFAAYGTGFGRIEIVEPVPAEDGDLGGTTPDSVIRARAPGAGAFWFSLDDQPPVKVEGRPAGSDGSQATFDPSGDMSSRTHLLVVAYIDGPAFLAYTGTFVVEG